MFHRAVSCMFPSCKTLSGFTIPCFTVVRLLVNIEPSVFYKLESIDFHLGSSDVWWHSATSVDYLPFLCRGLADTRKQMMKEQRRQLRKVESRQKKERQKSNRILKTFQSAVEAVTPHDSMVIATGAKPDSSSPRHFSATPLSSWHHILMSNSRYSVTNLSSEHVHLPLLRGASSYRPKSSPAMRSYSQPNLQDHSACARPGKPISGQGVCSDPGMGSSKPPASHLTRSRPALSDKQPEIQSKPKKVKKKKPRQGVSNGSKNLKKDVRL